MSKEPKTRSLTIKVTAANYAHCLKRSEAGDVSISHVVRGLIAADVLVPILTSADLAALGEVLASRTLSKSAHRALDLLVGWQRIHQLRSA